MGWGGGLVGNRTSIVLDSDRVVTATFGLLSDTYYTLTVATDGTGSGTVEPPVGAHYYISGTTVWLTATANANSTFDGWSGAVNAVTNSVSVTMDSDRTITASFRFVCEVILGADLNYGPTTPIVGDTLVFSATVYPVTSALPITYTWDFGDGIMGTTQVDNITHTFPITHTIRTYTVTMTARNSCPSQGTAERTITIRPRAIYLPTILRMH